MGDRLGTPGAVGFFFFSSLKERNLLYKYVSVKLAERSKAPDERMVCADRYTKAFTYAFAGSNPALDE